MFTHWHESVTRQAQNQRSHGHLLSLGVYCTLYIMLICYVYLIFYLHTLCYIVRDNIVVVWGRDLFMNGLAVIHFSHLVAILFSFVKMVI